MRHVVQGAAWRKWQQAELLGMQRHDDQRERDSPAIERNEYALVPANVLTH
jgi:hypothetical protein